jgi:hypothetical protein
VIVWVPVVFRIKAFVNVWTPRSPEVKVYMLAEVKGRTAAGSVEVK